MIKVVHVVNQFFAGLGGEEKAGLPVGVIAGSAGAARALSQKLGADAQIACTIYVGDNYFHEHKDEAMQAILDAVRTAGPEVLVAGPAFNSGRYGLSCVETCNAVAQALGIPCLTAMHEENPGVGVYRELGNAQIYCLPTSEATTGMNDAMTRMANFALRIGSRRRDRLGGQRRLLRARHPAHRTHRAARRSPRGRHAAQKNPSRAVRKRTADGNLGRCAARAALGTGKRT